MIAAKRIRQIVGKTWSLIELERDRRSFLPPPHSPVYPPHWQLVLPRTFDRLCRRTSVPLCRRTFKCKYTFYLYLYANGTEVPGGPGGPRRRANGETACLESSKGKKKKTAMGSWYVAITSLAPLRRPVVREFTKTRAPLLPSFAFDYCLPVCWVVSKQRVTHVHTYVCIGDMLKFHYRYYVNTLQTHLCKFVFFCVVTGYFVQRFMQILLFIFITENMKLPPGGSFVSVVKYKQRVLWVFYVVSRATRVLWISVSA